MRNVALVLVALLLLATAAQAELKKVSSSDPGTKGALRFPGHPTLFVGATPEALDEFMKYARAGDNYGTALLLKSGHVLEVKNGTPALIIDSSWTMFRVRVTAGQHRGAAVWVHRMFLYEE